MVKVLGACSVSVKGLGAFKKLRDLLEYLEIQGYTRGEAIYFLQVLLEDFEQEYLEDGEDGDEVN